MPDTGIEGRLPRLTQDHTAIAGEPFKHFRCPVTHLDEDVPLCRGHIVPQSFPNSARDWVVQRKDVDSFYGSRFEADFAAILYNEGLTPTSVLLDKDLSRLFDITITADGEPIEHFFIEPKTAKRFAASGVANSDGQEVFIGFKLGPKDADKLSGAKWETWVSKDIRIPALVSLLKAGYLTLYSMLGYRYALSFDGFFVGPAMLGRFFSDNQGEKKPVVVKRARKFFASAVHLVRPALTTPDTLCGTVSDRTMLLCRGGPGGQPWGAIVFVRTSTLRHAVLLPLTESDQARELFMSFLVNDVTEFTARYVRFEGDHWLEDPKVLTVQWPKSEGLLDA